MELPVRISDGSTREPVVSVDGAWGAPGLNLSHWPGNTTSPELRHELATGVALRFAALAPERRAELALGCVAIENNHFDTDGACSLFAVRHPDLALPRAERLLAAAAAGDFFRFPDEHALQLDAIVAGLADPQRSPWRERFDGLDDRARHELVTHGLMVELPALLDGDVADYKALWEPALTAARADVADLRSAARDDVVHLDLCVWTATRPSSRAGAEHFDPGRHALFGSSNADRILAIGRGRVGTTYRLLISTLSWFDLPDRAPQARPRLDALAARLDALEGTRATDDVAWRAQPEDGPSPELWFGTRGHPVFVEHAAVLRASSLDPARVRREIADTLRAACELPE